ncbi:hypothetical protein FRC02_004989 [Tulasnella sp. 418]|nr:hypothetical protein FRC02_004989 [Tulasnella sp. 418]
MTSNGNTLIQIASYNTNLQGNLGLPQDLVDWLGPTLARSQEDEPAGKTPDVIAVGFQELLPLHLGLTGLSKSVIASRNSLILGELERHHEGANYVLVKSAVNVGVALLVYARADKEGAMADRISNVQSTWTGCGPLWMGNKGAVGIRFRAKGSSGAWETFTFVNAHLTAHTHNLPRRLQDYTHIVRTLVFPSTTGSSLETIYNSTHLFFFGDLNFRLRPPTHTETRLEGPDIAAMATTPEGRAEIAKLDELTLERQGGSVCHGLEEGDFWNFPPTYKYHLGDSTYSTKRNPAWTDRILYATASDSNIRPLKYTSVTSYTTSDHKPVTALLLVPAARPAEADGVPQLPTPPEMLSPSNLRNVYRYTGKLLGWTVGWMWCLLNFVGLGNVTVGFGNFVLGLGAWAWFKRSGYIRLES